MATAQQSHAMTSYFVKKYKEHYGRDPIVNRHTARWGFDSVLTGLSPVEAKEIVDFYFTVASTNKHSLDWFFYNYDKLLESKRRTDDDAAKRARLREESEKRAKEWRERGNKGVTSN